MRVLAFALVTVSCLAPGSAYAQAVATTAGGASFEAMSLEDLLNVDLKVYSASKRAEDLSDTPAAIYAVTSDEIRRSGATSLPEALRVVPGLDVSRFNAWTWAISARGFSGQFNNKMLALMDGRELYSPLFGGVFWDAQDYLLADIEQIEVIRGPGGTLWGANAVNGVINVTTKSADKTQGLLATGLAGTEDRFRGAMRYGAKTGGLAWRAWGGYFVTDAGVIRSGARAPDAWDGGRGGVRVDWDLGAGSALMLSADGYANRMDAEVSQPIATAPFVSKVPATTHTSGADTIARYTKTFSDSSRLEVQGYYDHTSRIDPRGHEIRETGNVDVQQALRLGASDDLVAGVALRTTTQKWDDNPFVKLVPRGRTDLVASAFAQDELRLFDERLRLIAGSKFELNDYTGFEVQPTVRVSGKVAKTQTLWAAASRAVRTPARIESDAQVFYGIFPGPIYAYVKGNKDLKSVTLVALEAGWRAQVAGRASIDVALFDNQYSDVIAVNPANAETPVQQPDGSYKVLVPFTNERGGRVSGSEIAGQLVVNAQLTVSAQWTHIETKLSSYAQNNINDRPAAKDQANLRLYANITERVDYTFALYWSDTTGASRGVGAAITPARARMDMGLMARPWKNLEVTIFGQNLLDEHHPEIVNDFLFPTAEVERSFYGRVTTKF